MPKNAEPLVPGFWRCPKCGAPNPDASYVTHCLGCSALRPALPVGSASQPAKSPSHQKKRGNSRAVSKKRRIAEWIVAFGSWGMLFLVLISYLLIRLRGDIDWFPTILLFAPRVFALVPIGVLIVAAGVVKRRHYWVMHAFTMACVLGPLMDFNIPLGRAAKPEKSDDLTFGVMTLNRGKLPLDSFTLRRLIDRENIRLIFFQEDAVDPLILDGLPRDQWTYNKERTLATRFAIVRELPFPDRWEGEYPVWPTRLARLVLRTPEGIEFHAASAYLPSMMPGFERLGRSLDVFGLNRTPERPVQRGFEHYPRRGIAGLQRQLNWRRKQLNHLVDGLAEFGDLPLLVGGDLNTPADSRMLDPLRRSYHFAYEDVGWGYGYTRPTELPWTRIDHLFAGPEWIFTDCRVGPAVGSDHFPLVAHVRLRRTAAKGR